MSPATEENLVELASGLKSFMDEGMRLLNVEDVELRVALSSRQICYLAREYPEELAQMLGVRKVSYSGSSYTRSADPRAARESHYATSRREKPSILISK